jgi:hypothetical protein
MQANGIILDIRIVTLTILKEQNQLKELIFYDVWWSIS